MLELATATPIREPAHEPLPEPSAPPERFDPFQALGPAARERERRGYLAHLRARDGEIDWEAWTLPRRAERMQRLRETPLEWGGPLDRDAFYQHFHRVGSPEVDPRTDWLILAALANESERYGVEIETRELKSQGRDADVVMVYHVLQEDFHTHLLLEACRTAGLPGVTLLDPRRAHRWIIRAMSHLPDSLRYVLIAVGEAIGTAVVKRLRDTVHLFQDPVVEERLRSILDEILHDERLHVVHCRTRLEGWGLTAARWLLPLGARVAVRTYPQIGRLGLDHRTLLAEIRQGIEVPQGADWVTRSTG
ncbi:MAG: hypothetical protein ACQGVC_01380 [Myxococcota bacterium]